MTMIDHPKIFYSLDLQPLIVLTIIQTETFYFPTTL